MEESEKTIIPFEVTRIPDHTRPVGEEVLIQDGVEGSIVDGKTIQPKNEVLYYGTLEAPSEEVEVKKVEEPISELKTAQPPLVQEDKPIIMPVLAVRNDVKSNVVKKAVLEAARLLVFSIPGILITVFTSNPELGGSLGATILLVLKSVDRAIHEDKTNDVKGLLPF